MLTVDPSQKKVVWILMAVLLGAICVIAIRLKPAGPAPVVPAALATARTSSPSGMVEVQVQNLSRNAFKAPDAYSQAQARSNAAEMGLPMPGDAPGSKGKTAAAIGKLPAIQPLAVKISQNTSVSASSGAQKAVTKPTFALLATIQSAGGFSAVIKSNGTVVRVVNVGDTLDGGYKVRALQPGRAVLSNGEDTIVASKPQS